VPSKRGAEQTQVPEAEQQQHHPTSGQFSIF